MADIPQKLGKYEIRRELGRGAMGIVYEGWDPMIARHVALKTIRREQLERGEAEEILSRFQREAQAAGRLNHPNVVAVYDFGEDADGTAYIAMEYVDGKELKDHFENHERFSLQETVRLMSELLGALGHAHEKGIVHRDIKPANIFLLANGQSKVGDFGIARIESSNLTQAGSVLGTPAYMSPEQFMGQRIDGRSDLFSAGVILYQFLSGEKPFAGQLTTIMHKVLKEEPIAPSELNVQAPLAFDAVVRKAMAKRPDDRYQTAREFSDALQEALRHPVTTSDDTLVNAASDATVLNAAAPTDATIVTPIAAPKSAPSAPPHMPPSLGDMVNAQIIRPIAGKEISATEPAKAGAKHSRFLPIAAGIGAFLVIFASLGIYLLKKDKPDSLGLSDRLTSSLQSAGVLPSQTAADSGAPKMMTISAIAYVDPSDPRFVNNPGLMRASLREESRRELVEKAVGLYVQPASLSENYAVLRDKLLQHSADFIDAMIQEDAPQTGKDGLVSMSTKASVRVRDVQKSLNQMSNEERIDFIRNNGDPRISVVITTAASADAPQPRRSPVAENVLKEKIQSFGFRTWAENGGEKKADFSVQGEAKFKKLSVRLEASGLDLERTIITSWTIKCIDKKSGEEIYYNTSIPKGKSWNSEDEALADVGKLIGEEFSKGFFLQNYHFVGQKVRLNITGLPDKHFSQRLASEISGLRNVLAVNAVDSDVFDIDLSGGQSNLSDLVTTSIAMPLNRKFGKSCFNVLSSAENQVRLEFGSECSDQATIAKLDTSPAAALYAAPVSKLDAIVKNPELRRKLQI